MKRVVFLCACALAATAQGQVFSILKEGPKATQAWSVPGPRPISGAVVGVDAAGLRAVLAPAPLERPGAQLGAYGLHVALPDPTGVMVDCVVAESPVMEGALQARFPEMRTYLVQTADRTATGRLEMTARGLTAMLRTVEGQTWMIDLWNSGDAGHVVAYWLGDLPGNSDWRCETTEGVHGFGAPAGDEDEGGMVPRGTQTFRTVRLALACTGEWGAHQCDVQGHAPNVADPLAAMVTAVGRANVVYEQDLAVHYNLVANNDLIVYVDPVTDPYPDSCDGTGGADCSGPYLPVNISNVDAVIGNANFDIGHLMTRVFGGVAYLTSVCGQNKAGGISGIPRGGDIDPFTMLVMIHEMGHQWGANHTFNGTRGRCMGNVHLQTAWEAGSGSSPMAYAGGCPVGDAPPTDNVVQFAEPFFHHGSLLEMRNFLPDATCAGSTGTSNTIPTITAQTANTSIPAGTPFVLTAAATDADNDVLTYSWEERDSGFARPLSGAGSEDNGMGALFRIFTPVLATSRTFPRMADVLSGVPTPGEMLPTTTGVMRRFRVIVRDNHPGAGGVAISGSSVTLTIANGSGPFAVLTPVEGAALHPGTASVTWSLGGTNVSPISCTSVTIRLSTDDGQTFPTVLGASYPNNGSATVTLPSTPTTVAARIKIEGNARIFFAVSRAFTLGASCVPDFNHDGALNSQDFFDFLGAFFGQALSADFNHDGVINSQDFFDFVGAFFAGC